MNHPSLKDAAVSRTPAATVALAYLDTLTAGDRTRLNALQAPNFVLDVMCDSSASPGPLIGPLTGSLSHQFWPAWNDGFTGAQFHVQSLHTVAGEPLPHDEPTLHGSGPHGARADEEFAIVVVQWLFTGVHTRTLRLPIWQTELPATWQRLQLGGLSTYRVWSSAIVRETTYIDLDRSQLWEDPPASPFCVDRECLASGGLFQRNGHRFLLANRLRTFATGLLTDIYQSPCVSCG